MLADQISLCQTEMICRKQDWSCSAILPDRSEHDGRVLISVVGSSPVSREALSVIYPEGVEQQSPGSAALPRHPGNGVVAIGRTLKGFHNTNAREYSVD